VEYSLILGFGEKMAVAEVGSMCGIPQKTKKFRKKGNTYEI
jgi:hypothetical protein